AVDAKRIEALAGTFVDARNGMLAKLENVHGRLVMAGSGELDAMSDNRFRLQDSVLEFDGVDAFEWRDGAGAVKYRRAAAYSPSPADLAALAGTYASDEADATYVVTVQGGRLRVTLQDRPAQSYELTPAYPQAFATPDDDVIAFPKDAAGGHSELHWHLD